MAAAASEAPPPRFTGITADSRRVEPGWLFAALPGSKVDGRQFIPEAVRRGAAVVLAQPGTAVPDNVAVLEDDNPRRRLATLAADFYKRQPRVVAAVTGTNGKTSVATFARQLWTAAGRPAASLGTLGLVAPGYSRPGALTTADPVALHRDLAQLAGAGIEHVALEASSHGLDQHRLDALKVRCAAFTNLTRDHLDYHGTIENYLAAKLRLFTAVMASGGTAVLNADDPSFAEVEQACRGRGHQILDVGRAGLQLCIEDIKATRDGQTLRLRLFGRTATVRLPLVGEFQAMNAVMALGLVVASGVDALDAAGHLEQLQSVRGRLELAARVPNGAPIFVDYAHTPDALIKALTALRPHAASRLVVVFGAGGNRDPGKRALMGEAAGSHADRVYITDDNPRDEDPATIRLAILDGCPGAFEIGDRANAILTAATELRRGDALLIAGKGHEQGQIVGNRVLPFDDAEMARAAADELRP